MTLYEMKKKILALIEEIDPTSEFLTADPDIQAKINEVVNQIMFELIRIKKLPKYVEMSANAGDILTLEDIGNECGYEVHQVLTFSGVDHLSKAGGTVFKISEDGVAEIECYVYPERITEKTKDKAYEFELPADLLEILPYGVAGDLLKSDESAAYGKIYSSRYESMLQRLDPRYELPSITISGGRRI